MHSSGKITTIFSLIFQQELLPELHRENLSVLIEEFDESNIHGMIIHREILHCEKTQVKNQFGFIVFKHSIVVQRNVNFFRHCLCDYVVTPASITASFVNYSVFKASIA